MVQRLTPKQAAEQLENDDNVIYLDVRSTVEFHEAHVPGAMNIPLMEHDAQGTMRPNPDFTNVVSAVIPTDARVIVGCKVGPRSDTAARIMDQMGYDCVADMVGGFCGASGPGGELIVAGWRHFDLPVATVPSPGCTYTELVERARANG